MRRRALLLYYKKFKTVIPVIAVAILLMVAIGIGIAIKIDTQRRTDLILSSGSIMTENKSYSLNNSFNTSSIQPKNLIINGLEETKIKGYLFDKDGIYISFEDLFNDLGIKHKVFQADSIVEVYLTEGILKTSIGKTAFTINEKPYNLAYPIIIKYGRVLAPMDLLNYISGVNYQTDIDGNNIVLNYLIDSRISIINNLKITKTKIEDDKNVLVSRNGKKLLTRDGENMYYSESTNIAEKKKINVNSSARWSKDGEFVYWYDVQNDMIYIYSPSNGKTMNIKDPFSGLRDDEDIAKLYQQYELVEYKNDNNYKSLCFSTSISSEYYICLERRGERIIENKVNFSPDKKKMLYQVDKKSFYVTKSDGTSSRIIGAAISAKWVNNDKVLLTIDGNKKAIFSFNSNIKTLTSKDQGYLSTTISGECLYYIDKDVYSQKGDENQKLYQLPENCDYIYSIKKQGPILYKTSGNEGGVYIKNGEVINYIAPSNQIIRNINSYYQEELYKNSFTSSPKNDKTVMIGRDNDKLLLWVFDNKSGEYKNISFMKFFKKDVDASNVKYKWAEDNILIVYSQFDIISVDIKGKIHAFRTEAEKDMLIRGIVG